MPKDPHINGGIRHDWAAIKHYYVTDPGASLRKAAKKYGVSEHSIYKKSKAEDWFATRKKHQANITAKAIAETEDLRAKAIAIESEYLTKLSMRLGRIIDDEDQYHRHLVTSTQGMEVTTTEEIFGKADTRAMKDSFQMVKMMDDLFMAINNLERIENIRKHEIDAARLQLEREKFEFEKQKAEFNKPDKSNAIRIEGFEEGWSE